MAKSAGGLISLFCGPGGLDEGFKLAGFDTALAYDSELHCVQTHRRNHPQAHALQADLATLPSSEIVLEWRKRSKVNPIGVLGGPPCQAFSFANVHKRTDDLRSGLVGQFAEIITNLRRQLEVGFFVFENVTGLLNDRHRKWYDAFLDLVHKAGFEVSVSTLNAAHFGVAQSRERVFIVGINRLTFPGIVFRFPLGGVVDQKDVRSAIGDLPEPVYFARGTEQSSIPYHPNHWCMRPKSQRFVNGTIIPGDSITSRSFRALAWDRPSFTVAYGNREVHVHPRCHRRLSVLEALLLQGFSQETVLLGDLSQQFRMVCDAVSPPVAQAIGLELKSQLQL